MDKEEQPDHRTAWSPFNYNDSKQLHVLSVYLAASSWLVLGLT